MSYQVPEYVDPWPEDGLGPSPMPLSRKKLTHACTIAANAGPVPSPLALPLVGSWTQPNFNAFGEVVLPVSSRQRFKFWIAAR
jgi:hypothetical protein